MKTIIIRTLLLITSLLSLFSCTEDMNFKDVKVTPVKKLYTPAEGKQIQLLASTTASLFFEWEASKTEDSGSPLYEVVFDKEGGNFSNPIYRVPADNMGFRNYASISHKILNNIWGLAGIGAGDTGTLIWSVVASRGLNEVLALESRSLSLTRLVGFEVLPDQLYITGEGSEAGTDVSAAIACSSPVKGEFEIFTRLEAGKSYAFIDNKSQEARHFIIKDKKIIESQDEVLVEKSGIYKINLDFNLATITLNEVTNFGLFFCPDNKVTINMSYQGEGIWSGEGDVVFHQESWGRDERYKFEMEYNGADKTHWGPKQDGLDSRPTGTPEYFYMKPTPVNQWDNKWKFAGEMDNAKVKATVLLTADQPYTHLIEKL